MTLDEIEDLIRRYLSAGIAVVLILVAPVGAAGEPVPRTDPAVATVDPSADPTRPRSTPDTTDEPAVPRSTTPDRDEPDTADPGTDEPDLDALGPADGSVPGEDGDDSGSADPDAREPADDPEDADATPGTTTPRPPADRDTADPDTTEQNTDTSDRDAADRDTPDRDTPDRDTSDRDTPDRDTPDGDTPDRDTPDRDTPDGDTPDHETTDGDTTEENTTEEDTTDRSATGTTAAERLDWGSPDQEDDFTSGLSQWELYDGPGHADRGIRSPGAVTVRDGVLTITGDAAGTTGGMCWSQGQRYGRWEARVRAPESDPSYDALLLLWPDADDFPDGGEIDFMEMQDPTRQRTDFFLHHGAGDTQVNGAVEIDATQWHTWAVEWTPDAITAYVDGVEWFRTVDSETFPPGPMHLCIQLDWFPEGTGAVQESSMEVDWVRRYTVDDPATTEPAWLGRMFGWG